MRMVSRMARLSLWAAVVLLLGTACLAAEFTADVYTSQVRKRGSAFVMAGKAYVKDGKVRIDSNLSGDVTILVTDSGKPGVCLDHTRRIYRPLATNPEITLSDATLKKSASAKEMGTVKVSGYECRKTEYTFRDKGKGTQTRCFSPKLGFAIRVERRCDGRVSAVELRNIKQARVSDALFKTPSGYKKVERTSPPPKSEVAPAGRPSTVPKRK